MENIDLIHLQHAHVTKYSGEKGESKWLVRKNITSETIAELSSDYSEAEIFEIMEFARNFELTAFNEGIEFGKNINKKWFIEQVEQQEHSLQLLRNENERLSDKLIKLISKEE
jgi:hypothetical protein